MFVKLHRSTLYSTIWQASHTTRLVWVTMLMLADQHGEVMASVPGLADAAKVSLSDCEQALAELAAPDPYSRTPDYEGRRIEPIPGGWRLINYALYREHGSIEERRAKDRERQARHRRRHVTSRDTCDMSRMSHQAEAEADIKELGGLSDREGLPRGGNAPSACADVADPQRGDVRSSEAETASSTALTASPDAAPVSRARSAASRGTRLPEDWQPDADLAAWTRDAVRGVDIDLPRELERFRDHWHAAAGARAVKRDWAATWRNWVRRAVDDARRAQARASPRLSAIAQVQAAIQRRERERSAEAAIIDVTPSHGDQHARRRTHDRGGPQPIEDVLAALGFEPS